LISCTRLRGKLGAFEITTAMLSAFTSKTHDIALIWVLNRVHSLVTSASAFVCRATISFMSTADARLAFSVHIRAMRVITTVESSQIVFLLVLLLESGIEIFLHDRVDSFGLEHGLKLMAVLGRLGHGVD